MNYDALYTNPKGSTSRAHFLPALITVLVALALFAFIVPGRTSMFCVLVLFYPTFVLLARRLQDMGVSGWLVLVPLVLMLESMAIQLEYMSFGATVDAALLWVGLAVSAAFMLWACVSDAK